MKNADWNDCTKSVPCTISMQLGLWKNLLNWIRLFNFFTKIPLKINVTIKNAKNYRILFCFDQLPRMDLELVSNCIRYQIALKLTPRMGPEWFRSIFSLIRRIKSPAASTLIRLYWNSFYLESDFIGIYTFAGEKTKRKARQGQGGWDYKCAIRPSIIPKNSSI